jgi:hypothetical protein
LRPSCAVGGRASPRSALLRVLGIAKPYSRVPRGHQQVDNAVITARLCGGGKTMSTGLEGDRSRAC